MYPIQKIAQKFFVCIVWQMSKKIQESKKKKLLESNKIAESEMKVGRIKNLIPEKKIAHKLIPLSTKDSIKVKKQRTKDKTKKGRMITQEIDIGGEIFSQNVFVPSGKTTIREKMMKKLNAL
jgi:hypothetical protein